ncbi:hypothetical protein [Naasia sp. SYSU D00057]|uniref:hypothetical protein n=1 Tax=Naasia sp. SYSU D00057 TaxID=2817380 RepID=UPI001B307510|nr:hypothetical protein [Naasia sp. SYSU D00057]
MTATPPPSGERPEQVRVRRSAKILNFLLTGAVLGAVVALIATFAFPENEQYPTSQVLGFLVLLGVVLGAALGGLVAVLLDRALQRRTREVDAIREVTLAPEEPERSADTAAPSPVDGDDAPSSGPAGTPRP